MHCGSVVRLVEIHPPLTLSLTPTLTLALSVTPTLTSIEGLVFAVEKEAPSGFDHA